MTRSAAVLLAEFYAGAVSWPAFAQAGKDSDPLPELVATDLTNAYRSRDLDRIGRVLAAASLVPHKRYTAVLCDIAGDRDPHFFHQETALEVLEDIDDPASLGPMVALACRPDLAFDPTDWRKVLLVILGRSNDRKQVEAGLEAVVRSGNILRREAEEYLGRLRSLDRA